MTKTVLVTGGARRIGAACCRELHASGWRVIVHYHNSEEEARLLVEQLNSERPDSASCYCADLSDRQQLMYLAEYAKTLDVEALVNNASVFYPQAFNEVGDDDWYKQLDANLKAPFFLIQFLLSALETRQGCVVNLVDIHAETGLPGYSVYSLGKAALVNLTRCLAKELAPLVRVNAVAPGAILWPEHETVDYQQRIVQKIPLGRCGDVSDIAGVVRFLIEESPYITGQVLTVDGGRTLLR